MNTPTYAGNDYDTVHALRYELSLARINYNLPSGSKILELGGGGKFTQMLRDAGYEVTVPDGDYRHYLGVSAGAHSFDAVIAMEVVEHIHDQEPAEGVPTEWRGTGLDQMLRQCKVFTKPGGWLFVTTPNADSLNVVNKIIHRQGPMVYRPHVREYTVHELATVVRKAGFEVTHVETHECWDNSMTAHMRAVISRLVIDTLGRGGMDNRGEDIFLWAKG